MLWTLGRRDSSRLQCNNTKVQELNAEKWITKIVSIHLWFLLGLSYKMKHMRVSLCNKFCIGCEIQQPRLAEMKMKMMMTIIDKIISYTRFIAVWHQHQNNCNLGFYFLDLVATYVVLRKNSGNLNRAPKLDIICPPTTRCG
jgi:hypothetical protein